MERSKEKKKEEAGGRVWMGVERGRGSDPDWPQHLLVNAFARLGPTNTCLVLSLFSFSSFSASRRVFCNQRYFRTSRVLGNLRGRNNVRAAGALRSASSSRLFHLAAGKNKETGATARMRSFPVFFPPGDPVLGGSCRCHFPPPCVVPSSSVALAVRPRRYLFDIYFSSDREVALYFVAVVRDGG